MNDKMRRNYIPPIVLHKLYCSTPFTPPKIANKENLHFVPTNQCLGHVQDIGDDVKRHPTVKKFKTNGKKSVQRTLRGS